MLFEKSFADISDFNDLNKAVWQWQIYVDNVYLKVYLKGIF